jgi:hypothetical protein
MWKMIETYFDRLKLEYCCLFVMIGYCFWLLSIDWLRRVACRVFAIGVGQGEPIFANNALLRQTGVVGSNGVVVRDVGVP